MPEDNAFAPLEEVARRVDLEQRAARLLTKARSYLLLGRRFDGDVQSREAMASTVFFSSVALRLAEPEPGAYARWEIPTMCTDGKVMLYNPEFTLGLGVDHCIGVVVHEVMHVVLKHHCRLGSREPRKANIAMDMAVNSILLQSGFRLPDGALVPGRRPANGPPALCDAIENAKPGLSFEEYYTLLPDNPGGEEGEGEGGGDGKEQGDDPGGCGTVKKPGDGSPSAASQAEAEADVMVAQAHHAAKGRGTLPGGLERLVAQALKPSVDWRDVLRDFVSKRARNDYSWRRPNRRFLHEGLILPGADSEEVGELIASVDTSGSISKHILDQFAGELQSIGETFLCRLTILYHDTELTHVQVWSPGDGPLVLEAERRGGTSHLCVFDWIEHQDNPPQCLICLTDMDTEFPAQAPDYPVLWASVGRQHAPFGEVVEVKLQ